MCVCEDVKEEKKARRRERGGVKERGGSEGSERERERKTDGGIKGRRERGREKESGHGDLCG
jgi:hypothetical protein